MTKAFMRRSLVATSHNTGMNLMYNINIDVPTSFNISEVNLSCDHVTATMVFYAHRRTASEHNVSKTAYSSIDGIMQRRFVQYSKNVEIGVGARLDTYDTYDSHSSGSHMLVLRETYIPYTFLRGYTYFIYTPYEDLKRKLMVELGFNVHTTKTIERVINAACSNGMLPDRMFNCIERGYASQLSNLSPRAWDTTLPPDTGHMVTLKPDGEITWLL